MNHGAMIGLGGETTLMLHGFAWGVYTDQSGPRDVERRAFDVRPRLPQSLHPHDLFMELAARVDLDIAEGVMTGGIATEKFQIEASGFRGMEPDEDRWDIEKPKLDSWSVRGTYLPTPSVVLQISYENLPVLNAVTLMKRSASRGSPSHQQVSSWLCIPLAGRPVEPGNWRNCGCV